MSMMTRLRNVEMFTLPFVLRFEHVDAQLNLDFVAKTKCGEHVSAGVKRREVSTEYLTIIS